MDGLQVPNPPGKKNGEGPVRTTDPDNDSFLLQDVLSIVPVSPSSDQLYCVSIYIEREIMIIARGSERRYQEEVVQET